MPMFSFDRLDAVPGLRGFVRVAFAHYFQEWTVPGVSVKIEAGVHNGKPAVIITKMDEEEGITKSV